jgi:threonine/homoserine/homoserine lactone efflux protein
MVEWIAPFMVGLSTGLSGAMIPGPLMLFTVSEAFHHGQAAGIKVAVGHLLLEAAFVSLVVLGLREFLVSPGFRAVVLWIGGGGLVIMGGLILSKVRRLSLVDHATVPFRWGAVAGGAFFSLVSPGFLIWWATIGASVFLQGSLQGPVGLAMVGAGHAASDLLWYWFVAFSVEHGRRYCSDRAYRAIMTAIALSLIALGIYGIWRPPR